MKKKVMLAMSGGVDSSVALLLLKKEYEIIGATMELFENNQDLTLDENSKLSSTVKDAKEVADHFEIEHHTFHFEKSFKENVIDNFTCAYLKGETPNPCVECNKYIKFSKMLEKADLLGCDYLATGHYARISYDEKTGRYLLKKAADKSKDQSYVLYNLTQEQLARVIFPMGEITKSDTRKLAEENGLINADKPDSQDICFVPNGKYAEFITEQTKKEIPKGNFVDSQGNILGEHKGIIHYTIGQRKGLGIAFGKPMFVTGINSKDNTVILGEQEKLMKTTLIAKDINFISIEKPTKSIRVYGKIRYKQIEQPCTISPNSDKTYTVTFDEPQRAITPGQSVVFYDGDIVVGGGIIV